MTTTFETAQVGDRVWCMHYGEWTTITNIVSGDVYPIKTDNNSYTLDGKPNLTYGRTLFWDEVIITPPTKPAPKLEVDTKVLVWDDDETMKQKRYFSYFDSNSNIYVFVHGGTSWTSSQTAKYHNWELANE